MRRLLSGLLVGALLALAVPVSSPALAGPSLLFDVENGKVLEHQDAFARWYPASLTKLMTAYVTFKALDATQVAGISATALKGLSTTQLAGLDSTDFGELDATQIGALSSNQIGALSTTVIADMTTTHASALQASQIPSLTISQIGAMTATNIDAMDPIAVNAFTTRLPPKQLSRASFNSEIDFWTAL